MRRILNSLAAIMLCLWFIVPAAADSFTPDQKKELEGIIRSYLLEHPEVLRDVANALDAQDKKAADDSRNKILSSKAEEIFHDPVDAVVGDPKGDVTVVEFMDYNCSWCRKSIKEMQALLKADPHVRVVLKEFPIFGEGSEYAAKAALASVKQGKYWEFHQALFATPKVTIESTDQVAKEVGLDVAKMKTDMAAPTIVAKVQKNAQLAQDLALTGTPGFVVDGRIFPGYIPLAEIQAALAEVRANGGCKVC
jgi:protein-disulfide isomerase